MALPGGNKPTKSTVVNGDPGDLIREADRQVDAARAHLVAMVAAARSRGWSWDAIGAAFEPPVSRQAVWERFHAEVR